MKRWAPLLIVPLVVSLTVVAAALAFLGTCDNGLVLNLTIPRCLPTEYLPTY